MKILLLHQFFTEKNGNGGNRFHTMTEEWSKMGHEVVVLAGMVHSATGLKPEKYKNRYFYKHSNFHNNVDVIRCHVSEIYNVNFLGRLWGYFSFVFSSLWAGIFKLDKKKFDVIIVTSPPLFIAITGLILSKLKRIPMIFEVRDLWPESAIDTGVIKNRTLINLSYWFEKLIYRNSKLINVLTPAFKEILISKKEIKEDKIIFIPNASDFLLAENVETNFDLASFKKEHNLEDKFVITYAGAHGVANHLIQLIDTAEILKDTNAFFVLIGAGMQKKMLKEEAKTRKLSNVAFMDVLPKAEVLKFIYASDMGASVLKKVDTFKTIYSNKTFDYMSCKKPVLLAIDGVSRKLVEEADCGVFAEPENENDIAEKIKYYMNNPELGKVQGENGYEFAKKHFDRTKLARDYVDFIDSGIK